MLSRLYTYVAFIPSLTYSLVRHLISPTKWRRFDKITDNLWLGMLPFWFDVDTLSDEGISSIVTLNESWELLLAPDFKKHDFDHLHIPTMDYNVEVRQQDIIKAVNFIDERVSKNETCFVHCKAGRGRSVCIVASYLMYKNKINPIQALQQIQKCRPQVNVPLGSNQMKCLNRYYQENIASKN